MLVGGGTVLVGVGGTSVAVLVLVGVGGTSVAVAVDVEEGVAVIVLVLVANGV